MKKHTTSHRRPGARSKYGLLAGLLVFAVVAFAFVTPLSVSAAAKCGNDPNAKDVKIDLKSGAAKECCGGGDKAVAVGIKLGCKGKGSPVTDMAFAIIRFLSTGAGVLIVASLVWAGVQYTMATDDPGKVGEAKQRIINTFGALLIYIFAYAILNYVIPAGFFK